MRRFLLFLFALPVAGCIPAALYVTVWQAGAAGLGCGAAASATSFGLGKIPTATATTSARVSVSPAPTATPLYGEYRHQGDDWADAIVSEWVCCWLSTEGLAHPARAGVDRMPLER